MLDTPREYDRMAQAEGKHWWYRALHHLVLAALQRHPRGGQLALLDAGCGSGGLLWFLRQHGFASATGFDISPHAVDWCRTRGLNVSQNDLRASPDQFSPGSLDAVVCNDVLYFFTPDEQTAVIAQFHHWLAPGGFLIINVPALAAFRGTHDLSVGISRRFTRRDVVRLLPPERFDLVQARFWPFCLSPVIFPVRFWQRWTHSRTPSPAIQSDLWMLPGWLNAGLEWSTRFENAVLPWKPFGSSLFLVGRKH